MDPRDVLSQVQARPSISDTTERVIGSSRTMTEGDEVSVRRISDPISAFRVLLMVH